MTAKKQKTSVAAQVLGKRAKALDDNPTGNATAPSDDLEALIRQQVGEGYEDVVGQLSDDMQHDEAQLTDEILAKFEAYDKAAAGERARVKFATDSEYWFAVGFETREQKEVFLATLNWVVLGDKYIDGVALAAGLGIELPAPPKFFKHRTKIDKRYTALVSHGRKNGEGD